MLLATSCTTYSATFDLFDGADAPKQVYAEDLKTCPFGHRALKDVPIAYGLLASTPGQSEEAQDLEYWPGGCVIMPGSPDSKVVCSQCRYAYESWLGYWEKNAPDPADFVIPASDFILGFPLPANERIVPQYIQKIKGGKVYSEAVIYWAKDTSAEITGRIEAYLDEIGVKPAKSTDRFSDRRYTYYKAELESRYISIEVMTEEDRESVFVHVKLESEKEPWRQYLNLPD